MGKYCVLEKNESARCKSKRFGVARKAVYGALRSLEEAGLIAAERRHGKNPIITLVDTNSESTSTGENQGSAIATD